MPISKIAKNNSTHLPKTLSFVSGLMIKKHKPVNKAKTIANISIALLPIEARINIITIVGNPPKSMPI